MSVSGTVGSNSMACYLLARLLRDGIPTSPRPCYVQAGLTCTPLTRRYTYLAYTMLRTGGTYLHASYETVYLPHLDHATYRRDLLARLLLYGIPTSPTPCYVQAGLRRSDACTMLLPSLLGAASLPDPGLAHRHGLVT